MTRIQFSTNGSAVAYTLVLNPVDVDLPSAQPANAIESQDVIDGESITFEPYIDTRRHKLIWENIPAENYTIATTFNNQLTALANYVDTNCYIRMNEVGTAYGAFTSWTYIKGIEINKYLRRGGPLVYSRVEYVFELAES